MPQRALRQRLQQCQQSILMVGRVTLNGAKRRHPGDLYPLTLHCKHSLCVIQRDRLPMPYNEINGIEQQPTVALVERQPHIINTHATFDGEAAHLSPCERLQRPSAAKHLADVMARAADEDSPEP